MLLCNGKLVDIDSSSKDAKFVREKFQELGKLGWPIRLKFPDTLKSKVILVDRGMNETHSWKYPEGFAIENTASIKTNEGIKRWTYFETEKPLDGGKSKYLPKRISVTSTNIIFSSEDIEKVFFLVYCSGRCDLIEGLTEQAQPKRAFLQLDDKEREARRVAANRKKEYLVMDALFNTQKLNDDQIRLLAKSYGRDGVDQIKEMDLLRNWIFDVVTKSNDKESIDKFLSALTIPDDVKIRALIQDAKDLQVIMATRKGQNYKWCYLDENGKDGDTIVTFSPVEKPMKIILEFAKVNPDFVSVLETMVKERKK